MVVLLLLCLPLFAEESRDASKNSTDVESPVLLYDFGGADSTFTPRLLLDKIPKMRTPVDRQMGILPAPDPKSVQPNGVILKADPTVDLKMIYPKATRGKIVEEKRKKFLRAKPHPLK